jgi:3-oxoacyl-[acyl-carrier-protein] synthase-1
MKPVYLAGRGLACALGLSVADALPALQRGERNTSRYTLPGASGGEFPYHAIPYTHDDIHERARTLVQRVADEAGARHARDGVLFIATSSYDIGAETRGAIESNYGTYTDKIAAWLDWNGPVYLINTACTSSLNALLAAHALLQTDDLNEALVLGIELDNRLTMGGFAALQLLTHGDSKPFGAHRDGLVLGEAVAALRLSTTTPSDWQIAGGANVVDGSQPTGTSATAVAEMYSRALTASGLTAQAIDLIKVQAAGSPGNDAIEAQGLLSAFTKMPPLVSLKAAMGHTMGASGAAEITLLSAALEQGGWPVYTDAADATLGVELAAQPPASVKNCMATILGFGGSHSTVVLQRA